MSVCLAQGGYLVNGSLLTIFIVLRSFFERRSSRDLEQSGRTPGRKCFWYWVVKDGQGWMGGEKGSVVSVGGGRRRAFRAAPATQRRILLSPSLARLGPQAGPQAGSERQGLLHTGIETSACGYVFHQGLGFAKQVPQRNWLEQI